MREALERLAVYAKANRIQLYLAMTPDVHNLSNYPFFEVQSLCARSPPI